MQRELVERIDVGEDAVLIYTCDDAFSLLVTTRRNGDVEVMLNASQCRVLVEGLRTALDSGQTWGVWRQGDDGNAFLVEQGLTREAAEELVATFEARKHKQIYWARKQHEK